VFLARGFNGATLDEIAGEAGFSNGAVYSNFDDKDALFLALVDEEFALALERLGQPGAVPDELFGGVIEQVFRTP
jgi:AcrR family transcriptional regulator